MKTTNTPMFSYYNLGMNIEHSVSLPTIPRTFSARMSRYLRFWPTLCLALSLWMLPSPSLSLSSDGILLLSLKYSVLTDPFSVLQNWNYDDLTPCGWTGVNCTAISYPSRTNITEWRVTSLVLRSNGLIGSIPNDVGMIEYLADIDLSSNGFNGSLPTTLFNSSTKYVNLSGNSLWGAIPTDFGSSLEVLDLSLNRLNVSLPANVTGGIGLSYFNLSHNMIPGRIPLGFASKFSENATFDLSFNNLSGSIPESSSWGDQKSDWFAGNVGLCGKPLRILCSVPSTLSMPPNSSTTATATPAIAVIPKPTDSAADTSSDSANPIGRLRTGAIVGITVGDLAGVGAIAIVILYAYQTRKRKPSTTSASGEKKATAKQDHYGQQPTKSDPIPSSWPCLRACKEETSEYATTSESGDDHERKDSQEQGVLVMVDGETQMEVDTLLKASAYVQGTSASSIVYKAVLADGITYAVRRIGECRVRKLKEFENAVRGIEKVRHPNMVRVRGFYWGKDEKLLICDYAPNGSLAAVIAHGYTWRNASSSSSQIHLTLETRLKIARGIARGLAYVHEKKLVHGRIKPSNILLNSVDEPLIGDLGLDKLVCSFVELTNSSSSSLQIGGQLLRTTSHLSHNPYQPPEARDSAGPCTSKHDVYSYGVVLLELLTGRPISDQEIAGRARALEMADPAIRDEAVRAEDVYMGCFEVGIRCASSAPQRRPSMKEVVQIIEKMIPKLDLGSSSK